MLACNNPNIVKLLLYKGANPCAINSFLINSKLDDSTYCKMLPLELQRYILFYYSELSYINDHDKVHNTSSSGCITSE
ncbi:ankyrin repeat protein [Cheloniid poxvirus 1]|nr:ankyrin repeat protein [Cheloniid poxvirus 1]